MNKIEKDILDSICDELAPVFKLITPMTTDLVINPNGYIFIYSTTGDIQKLKSSVLQCTLERVALMLASLNNTNLNENSPHLSATIAKNNYRLEILVPPVVEKISISIRIPSTNSTNLEMLFNKNMFTSSQFDELKQLIALRKNIFISGETGCGKTTLLNALINSIPENERLVIIEEETKEVNTLHENIVNIIVNKNHFTGQMAVASSLRMNPDRIIYGETRDGASCLEMLKAWRTGHKGGLATIHSPNAKNVKGRIKDLLMEVCPFDMKNLVDSTVDAVVQVGFCNNHRKVLEILNF